MTDIDILEITDPDNLPTVEQKTPVRLPDGREGWLYPGGTVHNAQGHWMLGNNGGAPPFTSALASQAVTKREHMKDLAVENAIKEHGGGSLRIGLEELVKVQVKIASNDKNRRDATNAFIELLKIGGFVKSKYTKEEVTAPAGTVGLDSDDISILKMITARVKEIQEQANITPDKVEKQEQSNPVDLDALDLGPGTLGGGA